MLIHCFSGKFYIWVFFCNKLRTRTSKQSILLGEPLRRILNSIRKSGMFRGQRSIRLTRDIHLINVKYVPVEYVCLCWRGENVFIYSGLTSIYGWPSCKFDRYQFFILTGVTVKWVILHFKIVKTIFSVIWQLLHYKKQFLTLQLIAVFSMLILIIKTTLTAVKIVSDCSVRKL